MKKLFQTINTRLLAAVCSPGALRVLGVINIANALQVAWFRRTPSHWTLFSCVFAAATGCFALWTSSLLRRDIVISLPMPSHGQQVDVLTQLRRETGEAEPETDPKKVM